MIFQYDSNFIQLDELVLVSQLGETNSRMLKILINLIWNQIFMSIIKRSVFDSRVTV